MNTAQQLLLDELTAFFDAAISPLSNAAPISILTGVSGGADSVALIHLLHEHQKQKTLNIERLAIAHINHRLRGNESDGDEEFVRGIAQKLNVEIFVTKLDGSAATRDGDGMENWARNGRYQFFQDVRAKENFSYIATAHTANDQAETLIMRLMRGTGVRGLRGIQSVRDDGVIRPLINIERRHLETWLNDRNIQYRTDSSNADTKYRRNFIRNEVIPLLTSRNAGAISNIATCAASAARVWTIVSICIDEWINKYVTRVSDSTFHIDKNGLIDKHIASESLVTLFSDYDIEVSKLHINRIMDSVRLTTGEHLLPGGWRFYPTHDRVCITKT